MAAQLRSHQKRVEWENHYPQFAGLLVELRREMALWSANAHYWVMWFVNQQSQLLVFSIVFNTLITQACICVSDCLNLGVWPCPWQCWTSWGSHRHITEICQWYLSLQLHHIDWCCWKIWWECTQSRYGTDRNTKHDWSKYWCLKNISCHWFLFEHEAVDHNLLIAAIPYPLHGSSDKFISLQLRDNVVWDSIKCFALFQIGNINYHSLIQ